MFILQFLSVVLIMYFSWYNSNPGSCILFSYHVFLVVFNLEHGEGNGTPLQYSCLENPMDGGAQQAAVHGVTKSRIRLSAFTFTFHFHALEKEMATTPVFLPGESQGQGSLMGCHLWGHTELDTTEATQQQQSRTIPQPFIGCPSTWTFLMSLHVVKEVIVHFQHEK